MNGQIDRRRAIGLMGLGFGAAVLAACGKPGRTPQYASNNSAADGVAATATNAPGAAVTAAQFAGAASCKVPKTLAEGPYYIDVDNIRADIREDREGVQLRVAVRVLDADGCTPRKDAIFDIWHADAAGNYSGFDSGSDAGSRTTSGTRYLRGAQVTDSDGIATITTIFPGWYPGRAPHIHAKVFISSRELLTTQLFFDDATQAAVYKTSQYARRGSADTTNRSDGIFASDNILSVSRDGDGYLGLITIGVG